MVIVCEGFWAMGLNLWAGRAWCVKRERERERERERDGKVR
jgi:hypothetical protein